MAYLTKSERIMREVASAHGISLSELRGDCRSRQYSWPRKVAFIRLYDETPLTLQQIARVMGKEDHTTVLYALKTGRQLIKQGLLEGEDDDCCELSAEGETLD